MILRGGEDNLEKLPQFLIRMPGGRPRKTDKLSDAERARRSRKKKKTR